MRTIKIIARKFKERFDMTISDKIDTKEKLIKDQRDIL